MKHLIFAILVVGNFAQADLFGIIEGHEWANYKVTGSVAPLAREEIEAAVKRIQRIQYEAHLRKSGSLRFEDVLDGRSFAHLAGTIEPEFLRIIDTVDTTTSKDFTFVIQNNRADTADAQFAQQLTRVMGTGRVKHIEMDPHLHVFRIDFYGSTEEALKIAIEVERQYKGLDNTIHLVGLKRKATPAQLVIAENAGAGYREFALTYENPMKVFQRNPPTTITVRR